MVRKSLFTAEVSLADDQVVICWFPGRDSSGPPDLAFSTAILMRVVGDSATPSRDRWFYSMAMSMLKLFPISSVK